MMLLLPIPGSNEGGKNEIWFVFAVIFVVKISLPKGKKKSDQMWTRMMKYRLRPAENEEAVCSFANFTRSARQA